MRSEEAKAYRKLYKTVAWKRLRERHLYNEPLCRFCQKAGRIVPAEAVDHIKPHRGDKTLFHDPNNLQSLCAVHHSASKQLEEKRGYSNEIGLDGRPVDENHPANRS